MSKFQSQNKTINKQTTPDKRKYINKIKLIKRKERKKTTEEKGIKKR